MKIVHTEAQPTDCCAGCGAAVADDGWLYHWDGCPLAHTEPTPIYDLVRGDLDPQRRAWAGVGREFAWLAGVALFLAFVTGWIWLATL